MSSSVAKWNPLLWKKHIFSYKMLSSLHFSQLGLYASESKHETRMRQLTMDNFGIPEAYYQHSEQLYEQYRADEERYVAQIAHADRSSEESFYFKASKLLNLFEKSVADSGVKLAPKLLTPVLLRTLVEFGPYYELASDPVLRQSLVLYNQGEGDFDRSISPYTSWGSNALPQGTPVTMDLEVEILGHARRVVDKALSVGLPLDDALEIDPKVQMAFQLFKNYLIFVIGVHGFRTLAGLEHDDLALAQIRRTMQIDSYVLSSLDRLHRGDGLPQITDPPVQKAVTATLKRFAQFSPVVIDAWRDDHLDPEERVLSQYGAYHLLGISDAIAARYLRDRDNLEAVHNALQTYPEFRF